MTQSEAQADPAASKTQTAVIENGVQCNETRFASRVAVNERHTQRNEKNK